MVPIIASRAPDLIFRFGLQSFFVAVAFRLMFLLVLFVLVLVVIFVVVIFYFSQGSRPVSSVFSRTRFRRVSIGPEAGDHDDIVPRGGQAGDGDSATIDEECFSPPEIFSLSRETSSGK